MRQPDGIDLVFIIMAVTGFVVLGIALIWAGCGDGSAEVQLCAFDVLAIALVRRARSGGRGVRVSGPRVNRRHTIVCGAGAAVEYPAPLVALHFLVTPC
jgi:hypothetical protein